MRENTVTAEMIALAEEVSRYFITSDKRHQDGEGKEVVILRNEPHWVMDAVRKAHDGMWPDDYVFEMCQNAVNAISEVSEGADKNELMTDFANEEPSVYNHDLLQWLASNLNRAGFVDDAIDDFGWPDNNGIMGAIGMGWYREAEQCFNAMWDALVEELNARELA